MIMLESEIREISCDVRSKKCLKDIVYEASNITNGEVAGAGIVADPAKGGDSPLQNVITPPALSPPWSPYLESDTSGRTPAPHRR